MELDKDYNVIQNYISWLLLERKAKVKLMEDVKESVYEISFYSPFGLEENLWKQNYKLITKKMIIKFIEKFLQNEEKVSFYKIIVMFGCNNFNDKSTQEENVYFGITQVSNSFLKEEYILHGMMQTDNQSTKWIKVNEKNI